MTLYDTVEALGLIAIEFGSAPRPIKTLVEDRESSDFVIVCRQDKEWEGEYLVQKITSCDYDVFNMGNYIIYITQNA